MIFGKDVERFRRMEAELAEARYGLSQYRKKDAEYNKQCDLFNEIKGRCKTLEAKVREQCEADVFYLSHKLIDELKSGKKISEVEELIKQRDMAAQQMRALSSAQGLQSGFGLGPGIGLFR